MFPVQFHSLFSWCSQDYEVAQMFFANLYPVDVQLHLPKTINLLLCFPCSIKYTLSRGASNWVDKMEDLRAWLLRLQASHGVQVSAYS
jgi:hypothetical protein